MQTSRQKYYKDHKDDVLKYNQYYYDSNKDIINARKRTKVRCQICDEDVIWSYMYKHMKTKKHKNNIIDKRNKFYQEEYKERVLLSEHLLPKLSDSLYTLIDKTYTFDKDVISMLNFYRPRFKDFDIKKALEILPYGYDIKDNKDRKLVGGLYYIDNINRKNNTYVKMMKENKISPVVYQAWSDFYESIETNLMPKLSIDESIFTQYYCHLVSYNIE
jgi:hypothetical protein